MRRLLTFAAMLTLGLAPASAQTFVPQVSFATTRTPVTLVVDAREASRAILAVHETLPVAPGSFTLVFPQWIPGWHAPLGALYDMAELRMHAGNTVVAWRRDRVDMFAFHVDVPAGVTTIDVDFDVLMNAPGDVMASGNMAILNWDRTLLYQQGIDSHQYYVKTSLVLPQDWDFGTALRTESREGDRVNFAMTNLATLVDSPLDMGRYSKKWRLWKDGSAFVELDAFADEPKDLQVTPAILRAYERLPSEAFALYGSRHFADYHALLALSSAISFQGIEHHQSSDDRTYPDFLTNPDESYVTGDLVTHEFSHSWNGKYRRPYDLTTPNFQVPQQTDLLWVYEGMNQYLGDLLSFRCGLRDPKTYPELLAEYYAYMLVEPGRKTTPIIDVTTGFPYYILPLTTGADYQSIRRVWFDAYIEDELMWLDVDTIIRERSHGARSLDTFLQRYTLPKLTDPIVKTYTRDDIEALLNSVQPYDWHGFFQRSVYEVAAEPPGDELARSGWKLVWSDRRNAYTGATNPFIQGMVDAWFSLGIVTDGHGVVGDVLDDSPAWHAGLVPGETIATIDGKTFDATQLEHALQRAKQDAAPIVLGVQRFGHASILAVDYHGGPRYPHLVRIPGTNDMLAQIMAPHAR